MRQQLRLDCHSHCLPGMDDGAADAVMAAKMLHCLQEQGMNTVLLTPHYYTAQESVDTFLARRAAAFAALPPDQDYPRLILGAEVYLDRALPLSDTARLCIGDTDCLLLEMPFLPLESWMVERVEELIYTYDRYLILAHLPRYLPYYEPEDFENLLTLPQVIIQVNAEDLRHTASRRLVRSWLVRGMPILYGSDAHNMTTRRPSFDKVARWLSCPHGGIIPAAAANTLATTYGLL